MPRHIQVIERTSDGFTAVIGPRTGRKCVRCGCTDGHACQGGCHWMTPRANICSRCWTPADLRLVEELELLEDTLASLQDYLFNVDHCLEFYAGKGARS
jgi:hypothetical protein